MKKITRGSNAIAVLDDQNDDFIGEDEIHRIYQDDIERLKQTDPRFAAFYFEYMQSKTKVQNEDYNNALIKFIASILERFFPYFSNKTIDEVSESSLRYDCYLLYIEMASKEIIENEKIKSVQMKMQEQQCQRNHELKMLERESEKMEKQMQHKVRMAERQMKYEQELLKRKTELKIEKILNSSSIEDDDLTDSSSFKLQ